METEEKPTLDLGSIDFTPDWAKRDAGVSVGHVRPERDPQDRKGFGDKGGDRRPFGERKFGGDRKSFGERKPGERRPFARDMQGGGGRPPRPFDRPRPLDAEIKILPESKALGTIIRKLQQDFHAYRLKDLAYFFLDNPGSVLLKITPRAAEGAAPQTFHQCKACGFASTSEEEVAEHVLAAHLGDYYDAREIECEPPKGNFSCVAKCGLSGVLLGPPNIHEFNATVREMIRTRYPNMSEEQYRARIEMVRDPEAIEEWRRGAVKKTVFVAKGAGEDAPQLTREQAEAEFRRSMMPSLLDSPKNLMVTAEVALKSPVKPLVWAVRDALEAERRAPYNMCFALRGAFHHRKLKFFRANDARGPEFVTSADLKEFDTAHAIPELAKLATFIAEHPCSPRVDLVTDKETEKHLVWLVSTGHVVAFTNGVYSAVEKFPKYGPQWQKRPKAAPKADEPKTEEPKTGEPKAEEPKAEAPVEAPVPAEDQPRAEEQPAAAADEKKEEAVNEASAELA